MNKQAHKLVHTIYPKNCETINFLSVAKRTEATGSRYWLLMSRAPVGKVELSVPVLFRGWQLSIRCVSNTNQDVLFMCLHYTALNLRRFLLPFLLCSPIASQYCGPLNVLLYCRTRLLERRQGQFLMTISKCIKELLLMLQNSWSACESALELLVGHFVSICLQRAVLNYVVATLFFNSAWALGCAHVIHRVQAHSTVIGLCLTLILCTPVLREFYRTSN